MRFDLIFLLIGVSLILVELMIPGLYIIALGVGALMASAFAAIDYPPIDVFLSFLVGTGGTAIILKRFYCRLYPQAGEPDRILGKEAEVISVSKGVAKVKVGKELYLADGKNLKAGQKVKVTGKSETLLVVELKKTKL